MYERIYIIHNYIYTCMNFRLQAVWPKLPNLKWMHSTRAGIENTMIPQLQASSVTLTNTKASSPRTCTFCVPPHGMCGVGPPHGMCALL